MSRRNVVNAIVDMTMSHFGISDHGVLGCEAHPGVSGMRSTEEKEMTNKTFTEASVMDTKTQGGLTEMNSKTNNGGAAEAKVSVPVSAWRIKIWIRNTHRKKIAAICSNGKETKRFDLHDLREGRADRRWVKTSQHMVCGAMDVDDNFYRFGIRNLEHVAWLRNKNNAIVGEILIGNPVFVEHDGRFESAYPYEDGLWVARF